MSAASERDVERVTELLRRRPKSDFVVVVRSSTGDPVVTRNAPFERDGTPMPTRYWLLPSSRAAAAIGRLESSGGVRAAEAAISAEEIDAAHARCAAERDAEIPDNWSGPRPIGGVGGTRRGLKCLHAHYAHWLATNDDAVGEWVNAQLAPEERDR